MELNLNIKEPILVKNPHTGHMVNIAPLFDAMNQFDGTDESPANLKKSITDIIRLINTSVIDPHIVDPARVANINFDLFRLEDMFGAMSEYKLS